MIGAGPIATTDSLRMAHVTIRIPNVLQHHTDRRREIELEASTVGAAIEGLFVHFPTLRESLIPASGNMFEAANLFLNDEDVGPAGGLEAPISDGDRLTILPAMAGGAARAPADRRRIGAVGR